MTRRVDVGELKRQRRLVELVGVDPFLSDVKILRIA